MTTSKRSLVRRIWSDPFWKGLLLGIFCTILLSQIWFIAFPRHKTPQLICRGPLMPATDIAYDVDTIKADTKCWREKENAKYTDVKVLCWILTGPSNHFTKAIHIKHTWGRCCDKLLFFSTKAEEQLPTIVLNVKEGRDYLGDKTRAALTYIHNYYLNEYDWVLKADDDTYVLMENLWELLSKYDANKPWFFGYPFKEENSEPPIWEWTSGGAGYVLSKESLRRIYEHQFCGEDDYAEDVAVGHCLRKTNCNLGNALDDEGRIRFLAYHVAKFSNPTCFTDAERAFLEKHMHSDLKRGFDCCSSKPITLHYTGGKEMYLIEYLLNHVKGSKDTIRDTETSRVLL